MKRIPSVLAGYFVRVFSVAAASLVLGIVVAVNSGELKLIVMPILVIGYLVFVAIDKVKNYDAGNMIELQATCAKCEKLDRRRNEYLLRVEDESVDILPDTFYLVLPRKRRLREEESYSFIFSQKEDGSLSEQNLIAYKAIPQIADQPEQ